MPTPPRRGHLAVALVAALLLISASPGGAAVAAEPADPPAAPPPAPAAMPAPPVLPSQPGWRLRWAPQAATDGLGAFEHAEDDRESVENGFEWAGGDFNKWHSMPAQTAGGDPLNVLEHLKEMHAQ